MPDHCPTCTCRHDPAIWDRLVLGLFVFGVVVGGILALTLTGVRCG